MISLTMPLKSLKILNRSSFLIHLAFYQTLAIFFFFFGKQQIIMKLLRHML